MEIKCSCKMIFTKSLIPIIFFYEHLNNDYHLNFIDGIWWPNNILVAISDEIYSWDRVTAKLNGTDILSHLENGFETEDSQYVSSVSWKKKRLAAGTIKGTVEIWEVQNDTAMKRVQTLRTGDTSTMIGSLSWYSHHIITSGSKLGKIMHHDIRCPDHSIFTINAHTQEVCGLKWSPDGQYLASGGKDNKLQIWPSISLNRRNNQPIYSFNQHQAAVKALAWCPWQSNILASGGTNDHTIRFWNINTGHCLKKIDTKWQVFALLWSPDNKEIISGHGYPNNQLIIWKYPCMMQIVDFTGHTGHPVFHLTLSDGTALSVSAKKEKKLYNLIKIDPLRKKLCNSLNDSILLKQRIR